MSTKPHCLIGTNASATDADAPKKVGTSTDEVPKKIQQIHQASDCRIRNDSVPGESIMSNSSCNTEAYNVTAGCVRDDNMKSSPMKPKESA